jgi:hypothetical protein
MRFVRYLRDNGQAMCHKKDIETSGIVVRKPPQKNINKGDMRDVEHNQEQWEKHSKKVQRDRRENKGAKRKCKSGEQH